MPEATAGIGRVIERAYRKGCLYDAWNEMFDNEKWMDSFEEEGLDIDFYNLRERSLDELFPWDFIDIGVTKEFLKREWKRAMEGEVTPNCRRALFRLRRGQISGRCLY